MLIKLGVASMADPLKRSSASSDKNKALKELESDVIIFLIKFVCNLVSNNNNTNKLEPCKYK